MRGSDFLNVLRAAMPLKAELEGYGLEPEEIESLQASFRAAARESVSTAAGDSELEKMLLEYDCSTVEVGLIRFLPEPRPHCAGMQVAFCEADAVVVEASGAVAMYDHADRGSSIKCAANAEQFLDALALFVDLRREKQQWKGRAREAADLCAVKAGRNEFAAFFRVLCGFLG